MSKVLYHIEDLKNILKREKPSNVHLVTSKKIAKKLSWVFVVLVNTGAEGVSAGNIISVPDGEAAKTWDSLKNLLTEFSERKLDRSSLVIVLGGGTVGDLVGFACSIYMRGIRYIQIPTTLVAQVDSAHGAKTGIDFLSKKNHIGGIYEPVAIIADARLLKTLAKPQVIDGLGEIIKCGIIKDPSILSLLGKETVATLLNSKNLPLLIKKTIAVKGHYTNGDMHDKHKRQMLNFGHTVGHAIELKNKVSHGYAVLIGMLKELELTEKFGVTDKAVKDNLVKLLKGLDIAVDDGLKIDVGSISHDKKVNGDTIMFPVVFKNGQSKIVEMPVSGLVKSIKMLSKN